MQICNILVQKVDSVGEMNQTMYGNGAAMLSVKVRAFQLVSVFMQGRKVSKLSFPTKQSATHGETYARTRTRVVFGNRKKFPASFLL